MAKTITTAEILRHLNITRFDWECKTVRERSKLALRAARELRQLEGSKKWDGKRVVMPANETEGWPEERGTVHGEEQNGTLCVTLDALYRTDESDDLLREVVVEDVILEEVWKQQHER